MATIIERFQGPEGQRRLIQALLMQPLFGGDRAIAEKVAAIAEIQPYPANTDLIIQGQTDTDVLFILIGEAKVLVNGRRVNERRAGQHIGEMAMIDVTATRSATVTTTAETVIARVSEPDFVGVANAYPSLWRGLAIELASRLRQRGTALDVPNERPWLFVGSSAEGLAIGRELKSDLSHDPIEVQVWTDGVFKASQDTMDSLMIATLHSDFAVIVMSPDDSVTARGSTELAPRDNAIFELGLFMGALGRSRTFLLKPRGVSVKLPTDLLGVTPLEYRVSGLPPIFDVSPASQELRKIIAVSGPK